MNKRILAAALCAVLLSGCASDGKPEQSVSSVYTSAVTSQSEPYTEEQPPAVSFAPTADAARSEEEPLSDTSEPPGGEDSGEVTAQASEQPPQTSAETQDTPAVTEVSAAETASTTPAASTAATSAQTSAAEPVNVVIPEVRVPLSPGKDTAGNDKVLVDYSNSGEGYISVRWNESGKRVKLRIVSGASTYDHDVPTGGAVVYYPLSCGSGSYTVQIYEQTDGDRYTKVLEQEFTANIASETSPFLYPNMYVDFSRTSACVEKAAQLCAGKSGTIEKTAAVFQWITDNVTYDRELAATVKSGYVPDPDSVLKKKTGICYDYASLMAAMLRSQDIPTRLVVGYAKENIYHAWNEIWTEETGWITPELLLSKHGYNIADATFYAGSADKSKIADYISDSGNYTALYYY